jgi:transcriptional/translational regulatory protein YebC/TACO1
VSYMFRRKGQITVPKSTAEEDKLLEAALDAGAEDVSADDEYHIITTSHDQLYAVTEALRHAGIDPDAHKLTYIPETTIHITDEGAAAQIIRLCDALEENDDVQNVHANFDVAEPALAKVSA